MEFDIAVEITNKLSGTIEGGRQVLGILNLDGKSEASNERKNLNWIKFSVPIIYPAKVITIIVVENND